jgi:hypothetical protein
MKDLCNAKSGREEDDIPIVSASGWFDPAPGTISSAE